MSEVSDRKVLEKFLNIVPVYDTFKRVRSTGDMSRWWTVKPNEITQKSHINRCVFDSTWEATEVYRLDKNPHVILLLFYFLRRCRIILRRCRIPSRPPLQNL